jgi:hypothetical protein
MEKILAGNYNNIEMNIDNINMELLMSSKSFNLLKEDELSDYYHGNQSNTDYEKELLEYFKFIDNREGGFNGAV